MLVITRGYMCFRAVLHVLSKRGISFRVHRNGKANIMGLPSGGQCNPELINHKELLKLLMLHVNRVTQIPHSHSNYIFSYSTMW